MQRYSGNLIALAVALAALAGFVDAIAFSQLGFFASFMSGNSTRLGVALSQGVGIDATLAAGLVLAFVAGVVAAAVAARASGSRRIGAVLALTALLLALAAVLAGNDAVRPAMLAAAAAMGAMNGVFADGGEVTVGLTYMTGSLVKLGQRLAAALLGDGERWSWLPYLALWSGFVAGAVMGAGAFGRIGVAALWVAAGLAGLAAAVMAVRSEA